MHWRWRVVCVSVFVGHCALALRLSSVTEDVKLGSAYGHVAGFADFNADKTTDILFRAGENISIYLWSRHKEHFNLQDLHIQNGSSVVYTAAVDLDANGQVDLLTLSEEGGEGGEGGGREGEGGNCYTLGVYWLSAEDGLPVVESYQIIGLQVLSPPLVLDSNGDHVPDILVHSCTGQPATLWTSRGLLREFESLSVTTPLNNYHSAYYIDVTDDDLADVVVDGWSGGVRSLVLLQKAPSCDHPTSLLPPSLPVPLPLPPASLASPLAFADMDGDGVTEAVMFSCPDPDCDTVQVHILFHEPANVSDNCNSSSTHPVTFTQTHTVILPPTSISPASISTHSPVLGDINLDGYPDVITPASSSLGVLLLVARQCHAHCNGSHVTLEPQWLPVATGNITSVAYFDLWEDGVMDILLTQQNEALSEQLLAFRHRLQDDHAFLKVLVLSGHCYHDCTSGQKPYGSVLPGAVVKLSTTDRLGHKKRSVCTLTSGHTHYLPFVVLGLGETPSLVEELEVVVDGGGKVARHMWRNLVPNSQVIVIPSPPDQPDKWILELYLTPGKLVYSTAAVLAALFIATAVLVLLLQAREKFQDTKERRMAKHKFHFNAM